MTDRQVSLVPLPAVALQSLLDGDLSGAGARVGVALPPFFLDEAWLWRIRLPQLAARPGDAHWVVRAAVAPDGVVVGHAGFHGAPDEQARVEVAYAVAPELRGHGWAHALLRALLTWAAQEPAVRTVRASVAPDNAASLAVVRRAGFTHVGEQEDDDGLELVFERAARPR